MHDFPFSLLHAQRLADLRAEATRIRLGRMARTDRPRRRRHVTTTQLVDPSVEGSQRRALSLLALLALLGPVWSTATAWALPAISEFTLLGDTISELALGRYGVFQQMAFVLAGAGTLAAAALIRRATAGLPGSRIGSSLLTVYGLAALVMVGFPTDPVDDPADVLSLSPAGTVHVIGAGIGFLSVLVAMSVLTWSFRKDARWRELTPWIALFPAVTVVLLAVQAEGPLVGLLQRLLVVTISAWLVVVTLKARLVTDAPQRSADRPMSSSGRRRRAVTLHRTDGSGDDGTHGSRSAEVETVGGRTTRS